MATTAPAKSMSLLDTLAFAALGFLVGILIGMSESPLIAGAVTGGLTFASAIIIKMWDQSANKTETKTESRTFSGTETITETKTETDRNNLQVAWLLPLSIAAFFGVMLGAFLRINGTLNFRDDSVDHKLEMLGFNEVERKTIKERWAKDVDFKSLMEFQPNKGVGLMNRKIPLGVHTGQEEKEFDWHRFWRTMEKAKQPAAYIVENLLNDDNKGKVPSSFRAVIESNRKAKKSDDDIVKALKTLTEVHQ